LGRLYISCRVLRRTLVLLLLLVFLVVAAGASAGTYSAPDQPKAWEPGYKSALSYAKHRRGIIGFALRTPTKRWVYHQKRTMPAASTFKTLALTAYLIKARHRGLNSHDKALLRPMITRSSDRATDQVVRYVGYGLIRAVARKVPMYHFHANTKIWGRSRIDAIDMANLMLHIDEFMPERHRAYGLKLLASVTRSQRWGIGQVRPKGWHLYFKSGWGLGTGWVDHQVVLLTKGDMRVSVAVLQQKIGNSKAAHTYGKNSLKGLFARLLKGLDKAEVVQ
jgi:beta-lactamase family protein